jgi:hypothetical protein
MAFPDDLTLATGDLTYPNVTATISNIGIRKGSEEDDTVWRVVVYQITDRTDWLAAHKSDLFMDALKGQTQRVLVADFDPTKFIQPHRFPGNTRLVCRSTHATHRGAIRTGTKLQETNYVEIEATYRSLPYILDATDDADGIGYFQVRDAEGASTLGTGPLPYVSIRKSRGSKTYGIDKGAIRSSADPDLNFERDFQITVPLVTYHITYHKVPFLGDHWDRALFNTVNQQEIFGCLPGTLRYDGSEAEPTNIGLGIPGYDVTVDITWNPVGWNKALPAGGAVAQEVVFVDADTVTPYIPGDFSILLLDPGP